MTDTRYQLITDVTKRTVRKGRMGEITTGKIDRIVANRWLALPIFTLIMVGVYYVSIIWVGQPVTDWVNDTIVAEWTQGGIDQLLTNVGVADWMYPLVVDEIIGGTGAVLGSLPITACMLLLLAILEDIGHMSRIAFILDRIFRKFGLSGKSFILILVGTGRAISGTMATRTIENDNDRRITIIIVSFLPCRAKLATISLFSATIFIDKRWFVPLTHFIGIAVVVISGIILKKTKLL